MGRKSILLTHLKCLYFFYLNIITILFPRICPMSDETRQNRSKRDKMRQDIKLLIIATILQPDNLKIQYLCPFPAIIHYSSSSLHKEICVILVACALLLFGFIAHLDHDNLYRAQSVLKMYSRLFLVQTVSRLVSQICTHWLLCLNQSPY